MEYIENNYYQNKIDGKFIRFIAYNSYLDVYKYFDLETKQEKSIRGKNPFMKLAITICRIYELEGKDIFKSFIEDINLSKSYDLNLINLKYYLQNTLQKNVSPKDEDLVEDNINIFFNKIELLKGNEFKLTIEQKDNFLMKKFK